jgi:hypothetical protein
MLTLPFPGVSQYPKSTPGFIKPVLAGVGHVGTRTDAGQSVRRPHKSCRRQLQPQLQDYKWYCLNADRILYV